MLRRQSQDTLSLSAAFLLPRWLDLVYWHLKSRGMSPFLTIKLLISPSSFFSSCSCVVLIDTALPKGSNSGLKVCCHYGFVKSDSSWCFYISICRPYHRSLSTFSVFFARLWVYMRVRVCAFACVYVITDFESLLFRWEEKKMPGIFLWI